MLPHWLAVKYMASINLINTKFEALQHTESLIKATYPVLFALIVVVYFFNAIKAIFALFSDTALTAVERLVGKVTGQENYRASKFRMFSSNLAEQTRELISKTAIDRPEGKTKAFINVMNILYQIRSRLPRFLIGALFSRIVALTMTHLSLKDAIVRDYEKINREILKYYSTVIVTPQNKASCQYIEDLLLNTCGNLKGFLWIVYDKGPLEKIIIVGVVTFVLTLAAAKLATFLVITAGKIGTIGSDLVDREIDRFSRSQELTGFDSVNGSHPNNNNNNNGLDANQTLPNHDQTLPNQNQTLPNQNQTLPNHNRANVDNLEERFIQRAAREPNPTIPNIDRRGEVAIQNEAERLANVEERAQLAQYEPAFSQNSGLDLTRAVDLTNAQREAPLLEALRLVPQPRVRNINIMDRLRDILTGRQFDNDPQILEARRIVVNRTRDVLTDSRLDNTQLQRTANRIQDLTVVDDTHSIVATNIFGNF